MPQRRILSVWLPYIGAERLMRRDTLLADRPLIVVEEKSNTQVVSALNALAQAHGVHVGQFARDAHAMCQGLQSRTRHLVSEQFFMTGLQRWASKFSPWVSVDDTDGLVLDLTGCAHLFGGEEMLTQVMQEECGDLGLTACFGLADTRGAAWALARFAGQAGQAARNGDVIDQEARATRARAGKRRHWTKGGAAPAARLKEERPVLRIAALGKTYAALSPLPIAALRLDPDTATHLNRLGLRRIGDVLGQPRANLARRFGQGLVLRLDQAMGCVPEPVSPARPETVFAVRMTLPEPIGLNADVMAGIDRILPRLCELLQAKGQGVRKVQIQLHRTDHVVETREVGLARATHDAARIRPLLELKVSDVDAGFGIEMLRIEALQSEPLQAETTRGAIASDTEENVEDLIGRLGARVGLNNITRVHPASSQAPEKTFKTLAAAWSSPYEEAWPLDKGPRPVVMWKPEPIHAQGTGRVPEFFHWRGRIHRRVHVTGPERIAPEWWLDDPNWRSGLRDYWIVDTNRGERLWFFYAHGGTMSSGWFCQGHFL